MSSVHFYIQVLSITFTKWVQNNTRIYKKLTRYSQIWAYSSQRHSHRWIPDGGRAVGRAALGNCNLVSLQTAVTGRNSGTWQTHLKTNRIKTTILDDKYKCKEVTPAVFYSCYDQQPQIQYYQLYLDHIHKTLLPIAHSCLPCVAMEMIDIDM